MLPDPVTVVASSPNPELVLPVVRSDGYGSERRTADGQYKVVINHTTSKTGERHFVRIDQTKDATDPYTSALVKRTSFCYVVMDFANFGWSAADKAALYKALVDFIADSEVTPAKIIQFQS